MKQPKDNAVFRFVNKNPKGRKTNDCVIRALCNAMDKDYFEVYDDLCALGKKMCKMPNDKTVYSKYLELSGWVKHNQPRTLSNGKVYAFEMALAKDFPHDVVVANIGTRHVSCLKNGKWEDSWDCAGKAIGNYWTRG